MTDKKKLPKKRWHFPKRLQSFLVFCNQNNIWSYVFFLMNCGLFWIPSVQSRCHQRLAETELLIKQHLKNTETAEKTFFKSFCLNKTSLGITKTLLSKSNNDYVIFPAFLCIGKYAECLDFYIFRWSFSACIPRICFCTRRHNGTRFSAAKYQMHYGIGVLLVVDCMDQASMVPHRRTICGCEVKLKINLFDWYLEEKTYNKSDANPHMLFIIGWPASEDSPLPLCFLRVERNLKKGLPPDAHSVKPSHNVLPSRSDNLLWWRRCPPSPIQILIETSQSAAARPTRHKTNERTASFILELMRSQENFPGFISHEVVCSGDFCSLELRLSKVSKFLKKNLPDGKYSTSSKLLIGAFTKLLQTETEVISFLSSFDDFSKFCN